MALISYDYEENRHYICIQEDGTWTLVEQTNFPNCDNGVPFRWYCHRMQLGENVPLPENWTF